MSADLNMPTGCSDPPGVHSVSGALSVDPAGLHAYGGTAADAAARFGVAAAQAAGANAELLVPVFGVIGGDFVAAYGTAVGAHLDSLGRLATTMGSMSAAAHTTAESYVGGDADVATGIGGVI
jgi:hypothetical protein